MRISDWSSDVCSSDLVTDGLSNTVFIGEHAPRLSSKTWVGVVPGAMVSTNHPEIFPITVPDFAATLVNVHAGPADRKSVVEGKSVSVRVDLGGRRIVKKKNTKLELTNKDKRNN